MKKRLTSLALVLAFIAGLTAVWPVWAAGRKSFSDTANHYAKAAVATWTDYGVLEGYPDGSFRPDGTITRAELATVLDRVMGYQNRVENTFSDLPGGKWYTESVLHLAAEGILQGREEGLMLPQASITRQEAFAALARVLSLEESRGATGFADDGEISDWARGYLAAMKEAGYIHGDRENMIRPDDPITRAEVVTILNNMAAAFVHEDGTYSEDCGGNLIVNARDVRLEDMTIAGNLIVADGVGDGDVYLEGVTVEGDIILRGCGENSFHILPGCEFRGTIIVTKTTKGIIRLVNESGETIPMIYVNDGKAGVTLDGDELGDVVIACDAPVSISAKKVGTVAVNSGAKLTVEKGSTVSRLELSATAKKATVTVEGKVSKVTNDAKVKIDNKGTVGASGGSSSSGGGSSGGDTGPDTPPAAATVLGEVKLQLLAPRFGETPDTADVLSKGYTAETEWFNADGTAPTYRWKADSTAEDTFTASQAYKAVVTLTPITGYTFGDELTVNVTDGREPATSYTPAQSEKSGKGWVVTLVYDKTEDRDAVAGVTVVAPTSVNLGGTATLKVSYWNNLLVGPESFAYQWYRCSGANGGEITPIPGATEKEYTIPEENTKTGGELHYCCELTVLGTVYPSAVKTVEVRDTLDPALLPAPTFGEAPMVESNGRWSAMALGGLLRHKDVSYSVEVSAEVKKKNGATLGSSVDILSFDYTNIPESGSVCWKVDWCDYVSEYIFTMAKAGLCYDVELGQVKVTVEPRIKGVPVQDLIQEKCYDMTGQGVFYTFMSTNQGAGESWQGPPKGLQLVVRSTTGTFVDPAAPDSDPVPIGEYEQVKAIFHRSNDWVDGTMEGHWEADWNGKLYVPNLWLDWLGTGTSMPQVLCTFYASGTDGGMNVYCMKLMSRDIVIQSENN